jgi:hypothetical protein
MPIIVELTLAILLLIAIWLLWVWLSSVFNVDFSKDKKFVYTVKPAFMGNEERRLYDELVKAAGEKYLVFPHVPLTAVLDYTTERQDHIAARAYISRNAIDYLLVARPDSAPKLAIMLERGKEDTVLTEVLSDAKLPLMRLDNRIDFEASALQHRITELLP